MDPKSPKADNAEVTAAAMLGHDEVSAAIVGHDTMGCDTMGRDTIATTPA